MPAERNTTHIERGIKNLLSQWRRSPRMVALLTSWLRRTQRTETDAWDVADQLNIASGTGWILDAIGRIVGRGRGTYVDDDAYRVGLYAQIAINKSAGRVYDFRKVVSLSTGGQTLEIFERRGAFTIDLVEPLAVAIDPLVDNLKQLRPLGACGYFSSTRLATRARWGSVIGSGYGTPNGTTSAPGWGTQTVHTRALQ